jgi:hypothetical protein
MPRELDGQLGEQLPPSSLARLRAVVAPGRPRAGAQLGRLPFGFIKPPLEFTSALRSRRDPVGGLSGPYSPPKGMPSISQLSNMTTAPTRANATHTRISRSNRRPTVRRSGGWNECLDILLPLFKYKPHRSAALAQTNLKRTGRRGQAPGR